MSTTSTRTMIDLLTQLRASGAALTFMDGSLKCSAPKGALTQELREELAARKPEIIAFLQASQQASRECVEQRLIPRVDRSGILPLSHAQQRLWFLSQLEPESTTYNIGAVVRLTGEVNADALGRTLAAIVRRHEALRTSFRQDEGTPYAVIADGLDWKMDTRRVEELTSGTGLTWQQAVSRMIQQPFDIEHGPLFRACLVREDALNCLLAVTVHHMVCDGWSMGVFGREISEMYGALLLNKEPKLPELSVQYADFVAWQRKSLSSGKLAAQMPYWKKQLEGAPPVLTFPPDHLRPATDSVRGARAKLVLSAALTARLESLSQGRGVTLFMTLLAAFDVLLARYTGQMDIVVGSPSANRSRPELNPLIGFFANNLVLRTSLDGDPTFAELMTTVKEVTMRAYEHQDVPFDELVNALRPDRSAGHSPLFQVMFALQNFSFQEIDLPAATMKHVELEVETARFDLTVEIFPKRGGLNCFFDYKSDLYEPETIARLQDHFRAVLESVVDDPDQKIGAIQLCSEEERRSLLAQGNGAEAEIPETTFVQRFESHARATPDQCAVMCGDGSLTYAELNAMATRIAALLRSRGAKRGRLVAMFLDRSAEMVAAMLGIAKSGAAYVPLDPAYPAGRIANIIDQASPLLVLTTRSLLPRMAEGRGEVVCLDDPLEYAFASDPEETAVAAATGDGLAYVIFTSGSTGKPKGVQIPHCALTNFLESMGREPGLAATDVLLAVTTVSFDIAGLELLLPLYVGGTICVSLRPNDPESLMAELSRYRPSVMQATPATWKMLIAAGWRGDAEMKILCGGEALDTELARSLVVRCDELWNMYGPTETTIWSAALRIADAGLKSIPVGRPIQNTAFYVLDKSMNPVPRGVTGELWIGGEGLARGYLHRDDLTADRFVPCSFIDKAGAKMYRTGDLVRFRKDGTLDFFGRLDHQVKLRGYRIELGEIEAVMRECVGVSDAVAVLREDGADKQLVGYLTYESDEPPQASALRSQLRDALPEYMVPAALVFLKELPRLPNGKLDRSTLPSPSLSPTENQGEFVAPDTDLQQAVASAFAKVLKIDRIGIDNNFFDLGANSLLIVRVHAELNRRIDPGVPLIRFFQYPTVRALARFIETSGQTLALQGAGSTGRGC